MAVYLITGGCGFIGSHLADALIRRGDSVRILDDLSTGQRDYAPAGSRLLIGDVADPNAVAQAMAGVDGCFHMAAVSSVQRCNEEWVDSHRTNLGGLVNVLEASRRRAGARAPVVYASSAAVYGDTDALPLLETAPTAPMTAYGADKRGCELHARAGGLVHGLPSYGLRFFNVYGPRQDANSPYSGVIAIFAERLRRGAPITIYGDGEQTRDFIYVTDVVNACMGAMDALDQGRGAENAPAALNVCTGRETSVNALARTIAEVLDVKLKVRTAPARHGDIRRSVGHPGQAAEEIGFHAQTELAEGLRETLAWLGVKGTTTIQAAR